MGRIIAIILPIIILGVLGVGGMAVLSALAPEPEKAEEETPGLSVFAEAITVGDLQQTVESQGDVRPKQEITLSPQIGGRISFVSSDFIDGGFIRKGQVLVRIEAADYELAVVRARSTIASAEQRLAREVAEAEIAIQDIEDLGLTESSPLARREPQLAEARANLDSAKAQLQDAQLALNRTAVTAPFTGRVRSRAVDIGQFVSPGMSLGQIFSTDAVEVSLPLTDSEMGSLGLPLAFAETRDVKGPEVLFTANVGGKPRMWTGRVKRTAAAVNNQTRLINVIAELEDPFGAGADDGAPMAPGLFVAATIQGRSIENVMIAPRAALRGTNQMYVGDVETGTLSIREVTPVDSNEQAAYIIDGVEPGELAIVSPIQAAFDGMAIQVLERKPDGTVISHERPKEPEDAASDVAADAANAGETN